MHTLRLNALIVYTHTTNQIQSWLPPVYNCASAVAAVSVSVDVECQLVPPSDGTVRGCVATTRTPIRDWP